MKETMKRLYSDELKDLILKPSPFQRFVTPSEPPTFMRRLKIKWDNFRQSLARAIYREPDSWD